MLCAKIGDCPKDMLKAAGIEASDKWAFEYIETSLAEAYREKFGGAEIALTA